MGFLKSLFGSNDEPKIQTKDDGFFGHLVYEEDSYWEGKTLFKPTNAEVELIIDGDLESPHSLQKRFFRELEKRYSGITEKLAEDFHEQMLAWRKDVSLCELMRRVALRCIHIPECRTESESWDLVYQIEDDSHSFVVVMLGWEPQAVQVEEEIEE